jgi:WD40 repeat protein
MRQKLLIKHTDVIMSCGVDATVRLWDFKNKGSREVMTVDGGYAKYIMHYENNIIVAGSNYGDIFVIDLEKNKTLRTYNGVCGQINTLSKCHNGGVAIGSARCLLIIDINTGECLNRISTSHPVTAILQLSANMVYACSSTLESTSGKKYLGHSGLIRSLIRLNENQIVSGGSDRTIRVWDIVSCKCIKMFSSTHVTVTGLTKISDDMVASCGLDNFICLWSLHTDTYVRKFEGHEDTVSSITYIAGMNLLVSGSYDKTVRVWDINSGKCLQVLQGHTSFIKCIALL